jgi:hypothetical protein
VGLALLALDDVDDGRLTERREEGKGGKMRS